MRIASLLASGTEIVHALGLADQLVAISHECDFPPEILDRPRLSRPRFDSTGLDSGAIDRALRDVLERHGSVYELDEVCLRRVAPDLLISQAVCEVCAVPTSLATRAVDLLGTGTSVLSLDAHTLDEVLHSIVAVGRAAGVESRATALARTLEERMARVADRVAGEPMPRVLAIEWLDPPFAPGHWVPEMVQVAGGENVLGDVRRPSVQVSWNDLAGLDPDVLVVMPCGFGLEASTDAANTYARELLGVAERAVVQNRAFVVDGSSFFNRSGPRLADGVEILGRLLHPERVTDVDLAGRAAEWRPHRSIKH